MPSSGVGLGNPILKLAIPASKSNEPLNFARGSRDEFGIQIWLNGLADKDYSQAVVRQCFTNIRAITHLAKKQKFLAEDPDAEYKYRYVLMPMRI